MNVSPLTDSVCLGQSVQLTAIGEMIYNWSPATGLNNPAIGNPIATPDTTTIYQVTGSDSLHCFSNTQSLTVNVFNYPTINLGPRSVTIPVGTSYQINGIGSADIDSINWSPTIGLSCASCLSPLASPSTSTNYVITVENNGGCITADSIRIIVTCDGKNLFVPNTFSPNGDGMNDWFFVQGTGLTTIQSLRIFNRWGQLVFEKINFAPNVENEGWDGNFNGKKAPVDVYIYTIEVVCENSQVVAYHGNVALIR
jgi:gliding motility-associated-like protein